MTDLPINTASRAAQVYERILERISTGHYPQGHSLIELELGAEFGVSRTPVREALFRLVEYGLAEVDGRSIRVTVMSTDDVRDLFQVRQVLEVEAVRLACGRLTSEDFIRLDAADPGDRPDSPAYAAACQQFDLVLHRTIAERSGNRLLARELRKLHDRVQIVCRPTRQRLLEHRDIVEALRAGDRRAARQAMSHHLSTAFTSQVKNSGRSARPPR